MLLERRNLRHLAVIGFSVVALLSLGVPAQADVNLVTNGSFENTTLTNSDFFTTTDVTGWQTNSYTFLVFPGTAQTGIGNGVTLWPGITYTMPATSPDGGNFVAADGAYESGPITQTLHGLVAGQSYNVSFYQAGAQQQGFTGPTTDRWQVSLGSQSELSALMVNPSHDFSPWTQQTLTFQATSTSEVLSFLAVGTPPGVPPFSLLDGVSVEASTPEPAYYGLIGVALLGIFAVRRQLKKRSA